MKQKMILIASVVVGLLAAVLTQSYLKKKDAQYAAKINLFNKNNAKITVVALKENTAAGTKLEQSDLGEKDVIERSVRGHIIRVEDYRRLLGRKTVRTLKAGTPLHWTDIEGGAPSAGGLSDSVKLRMRAISINVSGSASVSGMVKPNDHVDVLGTFSFPSEDAAANGELELVTMTILQNVLVMATGKETANSAMLAPRRSSSSYNMVTLEVTPRQAEWLVFAEQIKGRLALALRNPDDVYHVEELPRIDFKNIQSEIEN